MAAIPVELRPFTDAHLPELTDLWVESWREAMPEIDFEGRRGWFVDHFARLVEAGTTVELACGEGERRACRLRHHRSGQRPCRPAGRASRPSGAMGWRKR